MPRMVLVLAALGAMLLMPPHALAHAELFHADPAPFSIIATAPPRISLTFSEQPELRFSTVQVLDRNAKQVDRGDLQADPSDSITLTLGVGDVPQGTYTVSWKTLSAVDGHVTSGAYTFTVGLDQIPTGVVVSQGSSTTATPDRVLGRFLTYLGFLLQFGAFPFVGWILLPGLALGAATYNSTERVLRRTWRLALAGCAVALLAAIVMLVEQGVAAAGGSLLDGLAQVPAVAFESRFGMLWWARVVLVLVGAGLVLLARRTPTPSVLRMGMLVGLGAAFVQALGSHAAAVPEIAPPAIILDWIHLAAMVAWVGGLVFLTLAVATLYRSPYAGEATRVCAQLVPRFSAMALAAVGSLVLTGVYQGWLHVGTLTALTSTQYGQALLHKIALIVPTLGLGALHLLVITPRLRAASRRNGGAPEVVRRLRFNVAAEVAFTMAILLVVGALTNFQPGREAELALGVERQLSTADVRADVRITPGVASYNTFDVRLTDRRGNPIADAEKVALQLDMLSMDMGISELSLQANGDGHYVGQGGSLGMVGDWSLTLLVRRAGLDDVRIPFNLTLVDQTTRNAEARPKLADANLLMGIEICLGGIGALALAVWATRAQAPRRRRALRGVAAMSAAAFVVGTIVAATSATGLPNLSGGGNAPATRVGPSPTPADLGQVARGQAIYTQYCATCHGTAGRGDGPAGKGLNPPPADFRVHMQQGHTDLQLYDWISNGFPGSAMPAWSSTLTPDQILDVIAFIRTYGSTP
jgi:copper transport protein